MSFVVFEGIDGSGKSTLIKALYAELQQKGISPILTREPGGTTLGQTIRSLLIQKTSHPPESLTETLLYYADRRQHLSEVIKPALKNRDFLISDRYWASTFAYQCGGRQVDEKLVSHIHKVVCDSETEPDLWILLDLPVKESLNRLVQKRQGDLDRFEAEEIDFHQRIKNYYLKLSQRNSKSWLILDAQQETQKLVKQVLSCLEERSFL